MKNYVLAVALATCLAAGSEAMAQNLVPKPVSIEKADGEFVLTRGVRIEHSTPELAPLVEYLTEYLTCGQTNTGIYASWAERSIALVLDPTMGLPAEGYRMEVAPEGVTISGEDYNGVLNGIQTFLQLLPAEVYHKPVMRPDWIVPAVVIEDWPAMAYRGVMLDVARTFVPVEKVLELIDNISHHKINKLHWHLADDEGWRVEIKSWPRLASVGGFRGGDSPVFAVYGAWDKKYGGYYTQEEIRQVVEYAAVRGVEVIPEIDLPGHSRTAGVVYPEIKCDYTPDLEVSAGYDVRNVWCVAREENYEMLADIIGELAELFPSEYIHLGGDEVDPAQWAKCPHCKALMKERGLSETIRLEDVFMERVIGIAAGFGKKAIVWDEAVSAAALPKTTVVYGWEGIEIARKAAAAGYPTVVCAGEYFYFDMRQSPWDRGHIWAGIVTLEKVYSFDLQRLGFTDGERANVRGVTATFFSELLYENGLSFLDYQLFPRVCALAEVAWSPAAGREWSDFAARLGVDDWIGTAGGSGSVRHFDRLAAMGLKFCAKPAGEPAPRQMQKPAAVLKSSLKASSKTPLKNAADYKGAARLVRAPIEGDYFEWTFKEPVAAERIDIKTGYDHLQRCGFPFGRVEVSYDGGRFERVADMRDLKATVVLERSRPIRALRIVCTSHGNGENFTIIQPLKIY